MRELPISVAMPVAPKIILVVYSIVAVMLGYIIGQYSTVNDYADRPDFTLGIEIGKMLAQPVSKMRLKDGAFIHGVVFESPVEITQGSLRATIDGCEWPAIDTVAINCGDNVQELCISNCRVRGYQRYPAIPWRY